MAVTKLSQIVKLNGSFRNSINLYLNLNKKEKIDSYIPTKSSLNILKRYVGSVIKNKDHSTILIGSYGKGKSHLLLILLAIVSMQRTKENNEIVKSLLKKIRMVDEETFEIVSSVWNKKGRFLPVIISGSIDDVSRSFMIALNDALKRENLMNLMPDTFFSIAEDTICRWKKEYPEVYINYEKALKKNGVSINDIKNGLKVCDPKALEVFKSVYPSLMGGEQFNPLTGSEVLPMYQSVADKLREQYGYSGIYLVFDEFSNIHMMVWDEFYPEQDEISSVQFAELGFGKAFGWDLKAEYEVMEHLADRGLIRMNRQLMPYTILKLVTEDELTNNLYSELC